MSTQTKVSLGIFWDIENCSIPLRKSASGVAKQIRDFIASKHPECGYALEFSCVCDASKWDKRILEGLDRNGVVVVHVNSSSKNAADAKLEELIDMFIHKFGSNSVLVVITGDINFAKPIRSARRKDITVVLIHGTNCSQDLRNSVNESYLFDDLIKDVENVNQNNAIEITPAHIEVSNLPKNVSIEDIRVRLSKIFDNCGGKVVYVHYERAKIRFACKDDAQRALQRFNGEDCFGQKLKLSLINGDPKQVKESLVNDFSVPIPVSNDCKSVIRGLETKKDQNLTKLVRKIVADWNDSQINSNLIVSVERNTKRAQEDGKVTLFVTAVNAEASKMLINGAKKYLNASHGVKWNEFRELKPQKNGDQTVSSNDNNNSSLKSLNKATSLSNLSKPKENSNQLQTNSMQKSVSDDCKSVIRGLETKKDQNVTKIVRKLVSSWNDSQINSNFIVSVDRNTKQAQEDGKITLFVTASNAESNKKLVNGAKQYIKPNEKIQWTHYQSKSGRNDSACSDESISSNNSQALKEKNNSGKKNKLSEDELKAELNNIRLNSRLFAGFLIESTSDADLVKQLFVNLKSMQTKYLAKNVNAFKQSSINNEIQDINNNLEKLFQLYENKFGKLSLPANNKPKNAKTKNMSVILGLNSGQKDDVLLKVRKIISGWNDPKISAEDIVAVSRDSKWKLRDGKAMLFVTAKNRDKNKLIIRKSKTCFNNTEEKLLWNEYTGKA